MLIGGIEAGGTKFVCAVGDESGNIFDKVTFPTEEPEKTLDAAKQFFNKHDIQALGVGSFGPVDLNKKSKTFGRILNTPKLKWKQFHLLEQLKQDYNIPVTLDTDVNAAALGEYKYGAAKNAASILYITVGTGIGAGFVKDGQTYIGKSHPEMGHIFIQQRKDDNFEGNCPYHGTCLEGLASGPAIEKRFGKKGDLLGADHIAWEITADYLAQAIINYLLILSPEKVIIGGGVMKQKQLYPLIRRKVLEFSNAYMELENLDEMIVAPKLNDEQGIKGAIALALLG
ncbi:MULTISPECIES: ROK family protein [Oceanobacillus]|uniref:ROK family protein n=1 Tax=Oceanobacillus TaxID=182709 RepID=UPI0026E45482|nr:ROK family protein [Oceanobacillus profundus]MDO6451554.1 ROK family protein [Oceanobacillus profundus]